MPHCLRLGDHLRLAHRRRVVQPRLLLLRLGRGRRPLVGPVVELLDEVIHPLVVAARGSPVDGRRERGELRGDLESVQGCPPPVGLRVLDPEVEAAGVRPPLQVGVVEVGDVLRVCAAPPGVLRGLEEAARNRPSGSQELRLAALRAGLCERVRLLLQLRGGGVTPQAVVVEVLDEALEALNVTGRHRHQQFAAAVAVLLRRQEGGRPGRVLGQKLSPGPVDLPRLAVDVGPLHAPAVGVIGIGGPVLVDVLRLTDATLGVINSGALPLVAVIDEVAGRVVVHQLLARPPPAVPRGVEPVTGCRHLAIRGVGRVQFVLRGVDG